MQKIVNFLMEQNFILISFAFDNDSKNYDNGTNYAFIHFKLIVI